MTVDNNQLFTSVLRETIEGYRPFEGKNNQADRLFSATRF